MRQSTYKNYLLILLMVLLTFNYVDRWVLGVVLQDIKIDLDLTDTQLGFLTGIAFALFYSIMGIPIARWADRGNRVTIITVTAALWSGAVALCGAATSFVQLMLIRIGVAVGEAGCIPPAHSLIANHFSRSERPRAVARYMLGVPISLMIGYLAAGWLNELYGWRATFVIVGVPGFLLAALAWFTLKEPRRMRAEEAAQLVAAPESEAEATPPFKEVCATLWGIPAFRHLLFCFSIWYFFGYGLQQWQPAFFIRSHGLATGELGTWFGVIYGVGGVLGVYLGGEWASRYAAGNERLQLRACALAFSFYALLNAGAFMAPNHYLAFAALGLANLGGNMAQGPLLATIQTLVPSRMRAMSVAILYLFANLIGMGLGPLAAGALSDGLRPEFGEESLRYALVILCPGYFWAAWHLWRAGQTVARDVAAVHASHGGEEAEHMSKASTVTKRLAPGSALSIAVVLGTLGFLGMSGIAQARLSETPAKGVDLSGEWKLNEQLSDDARKVMDDAYAKIVEQWRRRDEARRRSRDREFELDPNSVELARDPYEDFEYTLEAPKQITVTQQAGNLTVKDGDREERYRAGRKSVVSFGRVGADRSMGWNGRSFLIVTHSTDGEHKEERYSIDKNGRLEVSVQMSGRNLPKVLIRRVYDRVKAA